MLEQLGRLDRRWIFLLVGAGVLLPLMVRPPLPAVPPGEPVLKVYRAIEALPPGSVVWVGFDSYATTLAEGAPAMLVICRHLFCRDLKIVCTSTIPDGSLLARRFLEQAAAEFGKRYGVDYVLLGYKAGGQLMIKSVCDDLHATFPTDLRGNRLADLPLTRDLKGAEDFQMVFTVADNKSFDYYAIVANTQYGLPVAGAATAVMVPELYPYYDSGQIFGLLGGLRGSAEYERLTGFEGAAVAGMASQSAVHFLICLGVVLANLSYFASRRRGRRPGAGGRVPPGGGP